MAVLPGSTLASQLVQPLRYTVFVINNDTEFRFTMFHGLIVAFAALVFLLWALVDDPVVRDGAGYILGLILFPVLCLAVCGVFVCICALWELRK